MAVRPIDGNELYRIEKLLDTDIVRQDKVALNLLEQVLYDIQHVPTLTPPNEWVSVDEWLPDFDTEQILVTDGERYYISTRNNMVHIADREGIFIPGKSGAGVKITHWRPLPELPCRPSKETSQ